MRLPPLPKLRVRRPNQADANPCLTLMSSVLSMLIFCLSPFPFDPLDMEAYGRHRSLLGIVRIYSCWLCSAGDPIKGVYGCACEYQHSQ
jgi:hypothetical protein